MQDITFFKLSEYYQSLIDNIQNGVIQNLFSKINFLYFSFEIIKDKSDNHNNSQVESYLYNFLNDFKFIVYHITSNFENLNKIFPPQNKNSPPQNIDVVFCVESKCIIIEKINSLAVFKIISKLKEQKISLIDISSTSSNLYNNEIKEEINNFCLHFKDEIKNNKIVKIAISPIAGYFIRRYFYPTNYFKDQSFFIFKQTKLLSSKTLF